VLSEIIACLAHSNFITLIGYQCNPASSLNSRLCFIDHECWTSRTFRR